MLAGSKHCVCKIAVALGLAAALWIFVLGLLGMWFGYGLSMIHMLGSVYIGFEATWLGSVIGAAWAFAKTFLFIVVAGFMYCGITRCCGKKGCGTCSSEDKKQ